jgi:hypothetical protein
MLVQSLLQGTLDYTTILKNIAESLTETQLEPEFKNSQMPVQSLQQGTLN